MLMTHAHKLSEKQLMLLSAASQRQDLLLPRPDTLKGGAARALVSRLLAIGLVEEVTVGPANPHWRTGEDNQAVGLRITPAGLEAIGVEPEHAADADRGETPQAHGIEAQPASAQEPAVTAAPRRQREGTKRALVIALLSREQGASIDDLTIATGWLPHTTRAALTGLRQSGYAITRIRTDGNRTVYHLAPPAEAASVQAASEPAEV
jgi:hypothetical protein